MAANRQARASHPVVNTVPRTGETVPSVSRPGLAGARDQGRALWPGNGGANQKWAVRSNGTITGQQSGLCLDVTGGSTAAGTPLEIWTCNGQATQHWSWAYR